MLNTNVHENVRGDPYVTSGPFLPVILEWIIGSRCNLINKTSLFMPVFSISSFCELHGFHSLHPYEIILLFQSGVLFELQEISYGNLLPMFQRWMRVPRSSPNYPRGSKWNNMGIWGRETFVSGDHTIAKISEGWMNNSRKGMSTDKKDNGKGRLSFSSQ
jgi:hypothetical protein